MGRKNLWNYLLLLKSGLLIFMLYGKWDHCNYLHNCKLLFIFDCCSTYSNDFTDCVGVLKKNEHYHCLNCLPVTESRFFVKALTASCEVEVTCVFCEFADNGYIEGKELDNFFRHMMERLHPQASPPAGADVGWLQLGVGAELQPSTECVGGQWVWLLYRRVSVYSCGWSVHFGC